MSANNPNPATPHLEPISFTSPPISGQIVPLVPIFLKFLNLVLLLPSGWMLIVIILMLLGVYPATDGIMSLFFPLIGIIFSIPATIVGIKLFKKPVKFWWWFGANCLIIIPLISFILSRNLHDKFFLTFLGSLLGALELPAIQFFILPRVGAEVYPVTLALLYLILFSVAIVLFPKSKPKIKSWTCLMLGVFASLLAAYVNNSPLFILNDQNVLSKSSLYLLVLAGLFSASSIVLFFIEQNDDSKKTTRLMFIVSLALILLVSPMMIWEKNSYKSNSTESKKVDIGQLKGISFERFYFDNAENIILTDTTNKKPIKLPRSGEFSYDYKYYFYSKESSEKEVDANEADWCQGANLYDIGYINLDNGKDTIITKNKIKGNYFPTVFYDQDLKNVIVRSDDCNGQGTIMAFDLIGNDLTASLSSYARDYYDTKTPQLQDETAVRDLQSFDGKYSIVSDSRAEFEQKYVLSMDTGQKLQLPYPSFFTFWLSKSNGLLFNTTEGLFLMDMFGNYAQIFAGDFINNIRLIQDFQP
ncbi:MAG: hypothetical protein WCG99_02005 [Candidatus Berkelbacteria bacterium]